MENFCYRDSGNLHDYGIDSWTNAVLYLGMTRWAAVSAVGDEYYDWLCNEIGAKNDWRIPANFADYPKYGIYHADELCIAQFYIELYKKYGRREMIEPTVRRLNAILNDPPDGSMSSRNKQSWTWCDALFMAPPAYLGIAQIEGVGAHPYAEFMHERFRATWQHLFDREEHLFYRDDSYFDRREANDEKIFWGRGNGWVVAGLANILRLLPEDDPARPFYAGLLSEMAARLVQLQHPRGYWCASLLDPDSYPAPETSATSLIVYALACGVNSNLLDREKYAAPLESAWQHLLSVVDGDGRVGWVQPVGADPRSVTGEMTAAYGAGAFLLAASEMYLLHLTMVN